MAEIVEQKMEEMIPEVQILFSQLLYNNRMLFLSVLSFLVI